MGAQEPQVLGANGIFKPLISAMGWKGWDPQHDPERGLMITMVINHSLHPRKINMEHNHRGLEDHFPFQMDDL